MECRDIQKRLSEYLEDALSSDERTVIGDHLKSCHVCSSYFADLRKTIEHIKGLEEVEPPQWMAQKIMARVREESRHKKGILQKLFYPLHIKIPLEAVAAVLVVGLALYIYRDIRPEMKFAKVRTEESSPQMLQREIIKEDRTGPFTKSGEKRAPEEVTKAPEKRAEEPASGKMQAKTDNIEAAPKAPEPQKQYELPREERKVPPAPATEAATSSAGALRQEAKPEAAQAAPRTKALNEGRSQSIVVTVKVKEVESAGKEIEKIIAALEGRIIGTEYHEGGKVFMIELSSNKFNGLFTKLKPVGDVEGKKPDMKGHEGNVRMNLEVVSVSGQGQ